MKTYIGIDPSFRKGGFAMCYLEPCHSEVSESGYKVRFETFKDFVDFVDWVFHYHTYRVSAVEKQIVFCIEDSSLQNCTFDKTGSKAVASRMSRNVGMNQAASRICGDLLSRYAPQAVLIRVSPLHKGQKYTSAGFDSHIKVSGHHNTLKSTSQDKRDAYKLAVQAKSRIPNEQPKHLLTQKSNKL